MKSALSEETVLFVSIIKWVVLASCIGFVTGLTTTLFVKCLTFAENLHRDQPFYFVLLPLILPAVAWLAHRFAPSDDAHTTDKVIASIHETKPISVISMVKAFVLPILTIGSGGSTGKEAPCADVGAGVGSILSRIFRFDATDRRKLMICGVSAGFASVFGVPIAGSIFGVEVLFVGSILYDVLLPSFVSGITAYEVASSLGTGYFHEPLKFLPFFTEAFFFKIIVAGLAFGICSVFFIEMQKLFEQFLKRVPLRSGLKAAIAGVILVIIGLTTSTIYLGLGIDTVQRTLEGNQIAWYAPLMKAVTTGISFASGGSGGIITPVLYIGATAGSALSHVLSVDPTTLAAIGFVSLLAGTANTPIAASIMAVEMFGPSIAPYATIACIISFLMTGHRSVYPSQVLSIRKSTSLDVELGKELETIKSRYAIDNRRILARLIKLKHQIGMIFKKR